MLRIWKIRLSILGIAITLCGAAFLSIKQLSAPPSESIGGSSKEQSSANVSVPASVVVEAPTPASGAVARKVSTPSVTARVAPVINWTKYSGTLDSQANRALETHDGVMAMDLANKMGECDIAARLQNSSTPQSGEMEKSTAAQAERVKQQQEYQRITSYCQTVAGGLQQMRSRLLDMAIERQVVGAAADSFAVGVRRPDVLKMVVEDANAGDLKALMYVSANRTTVFGIDADTQNVARYALQIAAADASVGKLISPYLGIAESLSVPLGGEAKPKFDNSNLTEDVKAKGRAVAERLVEGVKAGKR